MAARIPLPETPPDEALVRRVERAVMVLGVCLGTRARVHRGKPLGTVSMSRRDGYRPDAMRHVRRYLAVKVLGHAVAAIARAEGLTTSSVYDSVRIGRALCRANARTLRFRAFDDEGIRGDDSD